ncbi:MAG: hypothetical protein WCL44_07380, partial [bacterium]
ENLAKRREALDQAWAIVREGAAEVSSLFESADLREMMRRLDDLGRDAVDSVLQKSLAKEKMAGISPEMREELRIVAEKAVGRLLMGPRDALKRAARTGQCDEFAHVLNDLFNFDETKRSRDVGGTQENKEA